MNAKIRGQLERRKQRIHRRLEKGPRRKGPPNSVDAPVFAASNIVHMVLKYHRTDYATVPKEEEVMAALRTVLTDPELARLVVLGLRALDERSRNGGTA